MSDKLSTIQTIVMLKEAIESEFQDPVSRLAFLMAVADDTLKDAHLTRKEFVEWWVVTGDAYDKRGETK